MIISKTMLLLLVVMVAGLASGADENQTRFRQPTALTGSADGAWLYVANRRSGSLSVVDLRTGRVVAEHDIAASLDGLAPGPDGRLLTLDRARDALLVLKVDGASVEVESRIAVAPDPVSLLVVAEGTKVVVASSSSRQLTILRLTTEGRRTLEVLRTIDLPFAPRLMAWSGSGSGSRSRLIATDAFGGGLALVDLAKDVPESTRSLPAHNIRGLAITPNGRSLVVAHQTLNRLAGTSFEDVHWGSLVGNHLRILDLAAVLDPEADLLRGSRIIDLGRSGRAAGDPGAIVFDSQGRLTVALTGVHEVALIADPQTYFARRVDVGQGPAAIVPGVDANLVYVADAFDDTITVVDVALGKRIRTIPLGPRPNLGPVDRGERLFFDARVSHDGWMSCQSCHTDGQSNGLVADTLSDGELGNPKRITSLLGVGTTGPWTWLGTTDRLDDQVRKSIETTMRGRTPTEAQVSDLTAYLRSLPPAPPTTPAREVQTEAVARGREVFRSRKCAECHAPPSYTVEGVFDVGLIDEAGHREFNPPSLRGVAQRPPYLHDGRAATLADVFRTVRHPRSATWSATDVDDLVAFLKTL